MFNKLLRKGQGQFAPTKIFFHKKLSFTSKHQKLCHYLPTTSTLLGNLITFQVLSILSTWAIFMIVNDFILMNIGKFQFFISSVIVCKFQLKLSMNFFEKLQKRLTLFFPMFHFDFSWKHHETFGFLRYLIWIEKEHWEEMGEIFIFLTRKFYKQVFAQFLVSI